MMSQPVGTLQIHFMVGGKFEQLIIISICVAMENKECHSMQTSLTEVWQ